MYAKKEDEKSKIKNINACGIYLINSTARLQHLEEQNLAKPRQRWGLMN